MAQGYNYSCNKIVSGSNFDKSLRSCSKIGLGLGWLRAVAQGHNYTYSKIELGSNFQQNLKSWEVN